LPNRAVTRHTPCFRRQLHVGCPNIGDREQLLARLEDILDRRWLTNNGPYVQAFEEQICHYLGVKHCIAICNATVGLEIAIRGLGLSGEAIVPSFTFPATAHALAWQGITPVFCDVDPATHNIDPEQVERLITPRTTGILGVHLWGNPCDVDALAEIANRRGLRLLYDAAHAFGCGRHDRMIGNFGDAEVFSFHATKFVNSGEGGAIVTNDDDLAESFRRLRSFGLEQGEAVEVGTNGKMSEFSAAMGLTSLESVETFIDRNRANYRAYEAALADVPGLRLLTPRTPVHNYQYVVVDVDLAQTGVSRDKLVEMLIDENVLAKKYFAPGCHRMEPYRARAEMTPRALPATERLCDRLFQLPSGSSIEADDISQIGALLRGMTNRMRRAA
jgi:dTDP-4-amino-4,6-dideoxygalactose transaminase